MTYSYKGLTSVSPSQFEGQFSSRVINYDYESKLLIWLDNKSAFSIILADSNSILDRCNLDIDSYLD
jgi:hypothetical protein